MQDATYSQDSDEAVDQAYRDRLGAGANITRGSLILAQRFAVPCEVDARALVRVDQACQ